MPLPAEILLAPLFMLGLSLVLAKGIDWYAAWEHKQYQKDNEEFIKKTQEILMKLGKINQDSEYSYEKWHQTVLDMLRTVEEDLKLQKNEEIVEELRKIKAVFLKDGSTMHIIEDDHGN